MSTEGKGGVQLKMHTEGTRFKADVLGGSCFTTLKPHLETCNM